jgi:hypothetical protein
MLPDEISPIRKTAKEEAKWSRDLPVVVYDIFGLNVFIINIWKTDFKLYTTPTTQTLVFIKLKF